MITGSTGQYYLDFVRHEKAPLELARTHVLACSFLRQMCCGNRLGNEPSARATGL